MNVKRSLIAFGLSVGLVASVLSSTAAAHVVVKPAEAPVASFQTFTVSVPSERDLPTTEVKLVLPKELKHVSPTVKQGWQIDVEKEGDGEMAQIVSLTWSGSEVPADFRDDFTFSAQTPSKPADLQWRAYQTYEDGQVVAWDLAKDKQPKKADGSPDFSTSGPFSVTSITAQPPTGGVATSGQDNNTAERAFAMSTVGIALGLIGIFLATRRKIK